MNNWLKQRLDFELDQLRSDLKLISLKQKDEEWKRDHYRYAFTLSAQKIYQLLDSTITQDPLTPPSESTKKELALLTNYLKNIIK
ncbi:MAG: hypothetical protein ACM34K_03210 [Bacillota bacterium]